MYHKQGLPNITDKNCAFNCIIQSIGFIHFEHIHEKLRCKNAFDLVNTVLASDEEESHPNPPVAKTSRPIAFCILPPNLESGQTDAMEPTVQQEEMNNDNRKKEAVPTIPRTGQKNVGSNTSNDAMPVQVPEKLPIENTTMIKTIVNNTVPENMDESLTGNTDSDVHQSRTVFQQNSNDPSLVSDSLDVGDLSMNGPDENRTKHKSNPQDHQIEPNAGPQRHKYSLSMFKLLHEKIKATRKKKGNASNIATQNMCQMYLYL